MVLHDIKHKISPLMQNYIAARKKITDSEIPLICQIHDHIQNHKGKQLRPLLTILSACCCGLPLNAAPSHPVFLAAAAIETLHTSTLVHDDVIDESDLRRGAKTVNSLWNNKTAVLMGDFYLAKVMKTINDIDNKHLTEIINNAVIEMSEGELLQQQYSGHYDIDENTYLQIISKKTAILIAVCCETGAILANAENSLRQTFRAFGNELGIAFQMRDDIIDYLSSQKTGKPTGNDIRECKCTLPLILALKNNVIHNKILPLLIKESFSDNDINSVIDTVTKDGYLETARTKMLNRLDNASQILSSIPDTPYRQNLNEIICLLKEI